MQKSKQMTLLGMFPYRGFSSIRASVFNDSIFMPEMYPAKLTVPYSAGNTFEFTMHRNETISEFKEKVLKSCPEEIKSFDLIPAAVDNGKELATVTTGELKTRKF